MPRNVTDDRADSRAGSAHDSPPTGRVSPVIATTGNGFTSVSRFCNRVGRRAIGASAPAPRVPFALALPTAPVVYTAVVEGGARVLVVEDEQSLATALVDGLTAEGFAVEVAADGTAGLRLGRRSSYDLIVLDLLLPGIDGYGPCKLLRRAGAGTPGLGRPRHTRVEGGA